MRIAHLQCASGIAGDMTLAALIDAGAPLEVVQAGIDSLGLPECRLEVEEVKRHGFRALKLHVHHPAEHVHRHLSHVRRMLDASRLSPAARQLALRIFEKLAEAEARVHGTTVEKVHFHEVGAVDSIADIVGTAIALDALGISQLTCEPVPTGHGIVRIAHGRTSIPAPATAELLKGVPLRPCDLPFELTTPTGAALVATLVASFGGPPEMSIASIGCGAGTRDLAEQANVLRVLIGDPLPTANLPLDQVCILETNLDNTTAEAIGYCMSRLMEAGALDVYVTSIQMKKNRPGVLLAVICRPEDRSRFEQIVFEETMTIGIRVTAASRTTLPRMGHEVQTPWGVVTGKLVTLPDGQCRFTPEYESCRRLSEAHQVALASVMAHAQAAFLAAAQP